MLLPGAALLTAVGLLTYQHATQDAFDHPLSSFLANILLQMLPLVALKMKIYSCGDRVSLVPRVLVKTLLMHLILEVIRIASQVSRNFPMGMGQFTFDVGAFVACVGILHFTFHFQWAFARISEHRDVLNLVLMAVMGAVATEVACLYIPSSWVNEWTRMYTAEGFQLSKVLFTSANYVDILAFMPVVLALYKAESALDEYSAGASIPAEARTQVLQVFGFIVAFYSWDDVIDPIQSLLFEPIVMMAHAAHFVLLLDFACFFIFQVWTPSSVKGEQLQGLLENGMEQDD